jgi:hypothetical protein
MSRSLDTIIYGEITMTMVVYGGRFSRSAGASTAHANPSSSVIPDGRQADPGPRGRQARALLHPWVPGRAASRLARDDGGMSRSLDTIIYGEITMTMVVYGGRFSRPAGALAAFPSPLPSKQSTSWPGSSRPPMNADGRVAMPGMATHRLALNGSPAQGRG